MTMFSLPPGFAILVALLSVEMAHSTFNFDSLWDFAQPAETETKFRALLPEIESNPSEHAQLLTQIARAQGL